MPTELLPKCPLCGKLMTVNLRADSHFVEDYGWYKVAHRYNDFIHSIKKVMFFFLNWV